MIQDIRPHHYENSFAAKRVPCSKDFVLAFQDRQVLVGTKEKEEGSLIFPTVEEFCENDTCYDQENSREDMGIYRFGEKELSYLFSIDETAFYLAEASEKGLSGFEWDDIGQFRNKKPGYLSFAGITGYQLFSWREDKKFCGHCGHPLIPSEKERAFICPDCHRVSYPKICPAVIVAVTHKDRILVSRYAGRTNARYALIAGFAEIGETIEETVHREVMEEVGVKVKNLQFYKSQPWSFSDSLLMGFFCELDGSGEIHLDETELAEACWLTREEMPSREGDISLTGEMMECFRKGER
ncbi:MAG: NAD(+) diphosphatase [Clostridiales bacterium]|nr:NAD(+) diphosphatase [Clostridiales bacterium]